MFTLGDKKVAVLRQFRPPFVTTQVMRTVWVLPGLSGAWSHVDIMAQSVQALWGQKGHVGHTWDIPSISKGSASKPEPGGRSLGRRRRTGMMVTVRSLSAQAPDHQGLEPA